MSRRSRRRQASIQLHIRLYPGQDDGLIRWLEQFDDQPYGVKSRAVKETLLRGIEDCTSNTAASSPSHSAELTAGLVEIRRVVEAAIETGLARFEGRINAPAHIMSEEDDETEDLLDALGEALILKD